MQRLRIVHHLRSITFLLVMALIIAAIGTLWWVNHTGLPDTWRIAIEREVSNRHGLHLKIGSISYNPLRGIIAGKVRVYQDADRQHEIAHLENLILDFDNTQLARGNVRLDKVVLSDATLSLPVDPLDPSSEILEITNANGTFLLPGDRRIVIHNAHGRLNGIEVTLNARFDAGPPGTNGSGSASNHQKDGGLAGRVIHELGKWTFDREQPPQLQVFIEGSRTDMSNLTARLSFVANDIQKNQHRIDQLTASAEITGNLLNVTSLQAHDGDRRLDARLDFDLTRQSGRFDVHSTLEVPPLLQSWFELPPLRDMLVAGRQQVDASGTFALQPSQPLKLHMTGRARCDDALLRGIRFDSVSCAFAWLDGDLFLKDMHLQRPDGEARGKALIQWPLVRIALDSTLLPDLYQPLFADKPMETLIERFESRDGARLHITLEGGFDASDHASWAYTGRGEAEQIAYHGIPVRKAACHFSLSSRQLQFSDGSVTFDYSDYPLRNRHGGPELGTAVFDSVQYDRTKRMVILDGVSGDFWPAPLVRMFSASIADQIEPYRFHTPPQLTGTGNIDVSGNNRTNLTIAFNSSSAATYRLLGSDVTLSRPSGTVGINGRDVSVTGLLTTAFQGEAAADLHFPRGQPMKADVRWTKVSVDEIANTYQLNMDCGGEATGRASFTINHGNIATLNGRGILALEHTELFSVPMFGPLSSVISSVISGVLRDKRAGFERAKSAFCSFEIKDGVIATDDFSTSTTSLVFAGEGEVDLNKRTIDMTMRLNARGLLGLITLPIRPFYGLFQFRGTGPVNAAEWENVMFTNPNEKVRNMLLDVRRAKVVDPGG